MQRQYNEAVSCAAGLERLARVREHRARRPAVPVKQHARDWWLYALSCHIPVHSCEYLLLHEGFRLIFNLSCVKGGRILRPGENIVPGRPHFNGCFWEIVKYICRRARKSYVRYIRFSTISCYSLVPCVFGI